MAGRTPRERMREQTMRDITRIGRQHLAERGAAALSLRGVARDLGVVSSAVYRYVKSRDELLTLLLVDAYEALGDAVDAALSDPALSDPANPLADRHRERFLVLGRAVRTWARAEPSSYALLYGAPVPGYAAPEERTAAVGTRVPRRMLEIVAAANAAGELRLTEVEPAPTKTLAEGLAGIREQFGVDLPDHVLSRGVLTWAAMFGCVSFELFGQYGPDAFGDPEALFEQHLGMLADQVGFPPPAR